MHVEVLGRAFCSHARDADRRETRHSARDSTRRGARSGRGGPPGIRAPALVERRSQDCCRGEARARRPRGHGGDDGRDSALRRHRDAGRPDRASWRTVHARSVGAGGVVRSVDRSDGPKRRPRAPGTRRAVGAPFRAGHGVAARSRAPSKADTRALSQAAPGSRRLGSRPAARSACPALDRERRPRSQYRKKTEKALDTAERLDLAAVVGRAPPERRRR